MLGPSDRHMATVAIGETQITSGRSPVLDRGHVIKGRYRVGELLGSGGMGAVYEVEHVATRRPLAMKVLKPDVARRPEMVRRFVAEARTAAAVPHPAIVEIIDLDQDGELHYIVMERLFGEELAALIRRQGPLPIPFVIRLGTTLADAMSAAHRHDPQVIHRDLKPENVFLARIDDHEGDQKDAIKILDFGIAKLVERDTASRGLTLTGEVCGTPVYMSPEQLRSARDVDERTDIYAIGVILYQALTGQLPFQAESFADLVLQVNTQSATPVDQLRPEVPPRLARLVERAMARRREDRMPTAAELSAGLSACLREPADLSDSIAIPIDPRAPRPSGFLTARLVTWVLAGIAGLALGLGIALVSSSRSSSAPPAPSTSPTELAAGDVPGTLSIRVSSIPDGARIYRQRGDQFLGTTDTVLSFPRHAEEREVLIFRKEGYAEEIREVNGYAMLVALRPARRGETRP
jgi:serine/threonine protein kinase